MMGEPKFVQMVQAISLFCVCSSNLLCFYFDSHKEGEEKG